MTPPFVTHQAKTKIVKIINRESLTHSRNERPNSCGFPSACNKTLQKIKEQSNLEAKLDALKEMISEGWLTHIQQHPTLLTPNWPFGDQIASDDGVFTKSSPNYHSHDSAEIYFRQTPQTTQSNKENQAKSQNLY